MDSLQHSSALAPEHLLKCTTTTISSKDKEPSAVQENDPGGRDGVVAGSAELKDIVETPDTITKTTATPVQPQAIATLVEEVAVPETKATPAVKPKCSVEDPTEDDGAPEADKPEAVKTETVDWKARILNRPLLVSVGEFDFEDFKNRWGEDAGYHIVELLMGSEKLPDEFSKEESRRGSTTGKKGQRQEHKIKNTVAETWIQRIRIHSPIILHYLQEAMKAPNWSTEQPRVFFRPFKALIHYHPQMKKALEEVGKRVADAELSSAEPRPNIDGTVNAEVKTPSHEEDAQDLGLVAEQDHPTKAASVNASQDISVRNTGRETNGSSRGVNWTDGNLETVQETTNLKMEEPEVDSSDIMNGRTALEHLRCYVDFMDQRVMPMEEMFDGTDRNMVRFDDLWFLFKVGDVVHSPVSTAARDAGRSKNTKTNRGRYQTAFMLYYKGVSVIDNTEPDDFRIKDRTMTLWCYYLDHDGESYGPVKERLVIEAYTGQKDIRELIAYPLRYAVNADKLRAELESQGRRFRDFAKQKHVSCEGWTLTTPPLGTIERKDEETPDHVESDVIIDFAEALRRQPAWKPEFEAPLAIETFDDWRQGVDAMNVFHWPSSSGPGTAGEPWFSIEECTQRDDDTEEQVKKAGIEVNTFLKAFGNGIVKTLDGLDEETNNFLLPRRFFVYVLRQRRFAMVDTISLSAVPPQSTIFEDLRIDPNHKLIVQSLVADHFEKRRVQRKQPIIGSMNQDLVRGKGSGLFILLHGVPGVGKTATAEAVAQANNKPLFTITCGDLGLTPEAVDSKLNEVFRLAHLWDCVLLLDEADIFLARRDTFNLKRNALVSVFLRVLEYYSGILFLTTNRVGILDEAFKSRIHISLYYEPLSRHQTVEIFRVNIKKLRAIEDEKQQQHQGTDVEKPRLLIKAKSIIEYAQQYFDEQEETPHLRWNGRQIRNAFQIASSLAHYNIRKTSLSELDIASGQVACPVLDDTQFDKVAEAIERFGNYMDHTRAMTDADQARLDAIRADDIRNSDLAPRKRGYSTFGTPATQTSTQDRRPAGDSYQTRRTSGTGQMSPRIPASGNASTSRVQGKGRGNFQGQAGRIDPQTQRGGTRMGERTASSQMRTQRRSGAPNSRAYPRQEPSRRRQQPSFDEYYDEEEGQPEGLGEEAAFYGRHQDETFDEEDVDDFEEGAEWKDEETGVEDGGEDYDD